MSNNSEKLTPAAEAYDSKALAESGKEHQERLQEDRERAAEKSKEHTVESARHEVEQANRHEKQRDEKTAEKSPAERRGPASKRERNTSYDRTMREVRSQMSGPSRAFSSFIHSPVIEKASDAIGGTVARPNAILSGSAFAFLFTLGFYLVARFNGYPLSGTETIASFIAGWAFGLIFDYLRLLITGKK